jgi:hypothetical protein
MSKSVIVVLRHGCDGGNGPREEIDFNPDVTVTNHSSRGKVKDNKVTIVIDWLGDLGLKQAHGLGDALPDLLGAYCPVSRIITEGPGDGHDGTPNPLYTIRYAAKKLAASFKHLTNKNLSLDLYDNDAYKDPKVFSVDALLQDGKGQYSTIVSWEAKGMWRHSDGGFQKDSLLGQLGHCGSGGHKVENHHLISDHSPYKGQVIYIFECNEDNSLTLRVFAYDPSTTGNGFTEIKSGSDWPSNLCR